MAREEFDELADERSVAGRHPKDKSHRLKRRSWLDRFFDRLIGGPERPGEQKVARSPVVLILIGATLGGLILSGIFWFMIASTREERMLKEATLSLTQERYPDAEAQFAAFLDAHPASESTPVARIGLHRSRVEKNIMPDTPNVVAGLEELKTLLKECRELPGFSDLKSDIRRYADRLTFAGARVAEITQSKEALDVSVESLELLRRYADEGVIPPNREQALLNRQRVASASVAKKADFLATLDNVKKQLEVGDTIGAIVSRDSLISKYPLLKNDKDVSKILQDILAREKEFVVKTESGNDGLPAADEASTIPSLALTLRTQATTELSSQGRLVFSIGIDSCYAVDADTGSPVWRRPIGTDSPFAPIEAKATTPEGLLVYSTSAEELQMLSQRDGTVVWRQTLGSRPTGAPVLIADNFYATTEAGELWQIAAITGRAVAKLKFSQPIIGPPAISSDSQRLVIPGDRTLVYTIGINPFACLAVSHVPHQTGSVKAPMIAAGRYFLMCDNNTAERARVQTLEMNQGGQLAFVSEDWVDGQVNDPCLLRGYELYVPSTPQRITAFRVTDEAGQVPLAKVGANQLEESPVQARMFLLAGPGNQLWLAGRDLRKFQSQTNSVVLEPGMTAEGIHTRPIQFVDEAVFLTSRNQNSNSIFFTRADREQMKGIWRTVLGSRIVAVAPSAGGQALLAIADYGEAYRVTMADLKKGGFVMESISRFRLPEKLSSNVDGIVLKDGRPAAWCGTPEPSMWTFTSTGQLERKWTLPAAPQVPPVAIDGGVVFAMDGRLHISATAGGKPAEDYRSSQSQDQQQPWKSLTAISATQVLGITSDNQFVKVEYRATPRPQLKEVSVTKSPHLIEVPPAAANGFLFLATVEGKLVLMQASSLEVLAEVDLGGVPSAAPQVAGEHVFVEVAGQDVKVFHIDNTLPLTGSIKLDGHSLAGSPLAVATGFLLARTDGALIQLDANGVPTGGKKSLGQSLQKGLMEVNGQIVTVGLDGSLYVIDATTLK